MGFGAGSANVSASHGAAAKGNGFASHGLGARKAPLATSSSREKIRPSRFLLVNFLSFLVSYDYYHSATKFLTTRKSTFLLHCAHFSFIYPLFIECYFI